MSLPQPLAYPSLGARDSALGDVSSFWETPLKRRSSSEFCRFNGDAPTNL